MSEIIYFSKEGLHNLKQEVNDLRTKGRINMAKQIAEAREKGDLSENAEYDAAKEAQGLLELKISKLQAILSNAREMTTDLIDTNKVGVLCLVTIRNLKTKSEINYRLVAEKEANIKENKISITSPIGKGLLGKKIGEIAEIVIPAGTLQMQILDINY